MFTVVIYRTKQCRRSKASITDMIFLDSDAVALLLDDCCKTVQEMKTFDFDDPASRNNEAYYNIAVLRKSKSFVILNVSHAIA